MALVGGKIQIRTIYHLLLENVRFALTKSMIMYSYIVH